MILRTEVTVAEQSKHNGKWSIGFNNYIGRSATEEYLSSSCTSSAVFDTEDEAYEGGSRALTCLVQTGMFPNLCERF